MPLTSYCYSYVITEIGYLVVGFFMTWCNFPHNNIGVIRFFGSRRKLGQNANFFIKSLRYWNGVCNNKISKSQKISTCYEMYILFIFEKTKQKGSIEPFGSSRVKTIHAGRMAELF